MLTTILTFIAFILALSIHYSLKDRELNSKDRLNYIQNYKSYILVFEICLDKAFQIIYKDQILIYSIEATSFDSERYNAASRSFLALSLKILGPTLVAELSNFFGDEETLLFNIAEYFNTKYEHDEIKNAAIENLMNSDIDDTVVGDTKYE